MAIHLNTTPNPSAIKFNGVDLDKVYFNTVLVWQKTLIIDVPHHFSNGSSQGHPYVSIEKLITAYRKHGESNITIRVAKGVVIPSMIMDQHLTGGITKVILENHGEIQDSNRGYGLYVYPFTTLVLNNLGAIRGRGGHGGTGGTGHVGKAGAKGADVAASHKKVVASKVSWSMMSNTASVPRTYSGSYTIIQGQGWLVAVHMNNGLVVGVTVNSPCGAGHAFCGTGQGYATAAIRGNVILITGGVTAGSKVTYRTVTTPKKVGGAGGVGGTGGTGGVGGAGQYYLHKNVVGVGGNGGGVGGVGKPSRPAGGHSGAHGGTGYRGGAGGWGQVWGAKGNIGGTGTGGGHVGAGGGAAGNSIQGINHCTIVARGTLSGTPINT